MLIYYPVEIAKYGGKAMSDKNNQDLRGQIDDLFYEAHRTAATIEGLLRRVNVPEGGWCPGKWGACTGGTLTVRDEEGRIIRQETILHPSAKWANETAVYANNKTQAVIDDDKKRPSINLVNEEAKIWAGGIPFQYICPESGTEKTGSIAFSGWPQLGDHTAVVVWAFQARIKIDKDALLDECPGSSFKEAILEADKELAA